MKSIDNYDLVVVGCGFTGGLIAHLAAKHHNSRVLILEKRKHIAGNMYDEEDAETGILIQKYGPHSFHTDSKEVFELVRGIGEWEPFVLRARAQIEQKLTPSPFNFKTIEDYFDPETAMTIKTHLAEKFCYRPKVTILEMLNSDDPVIREYAEFLFQKDYRPYTAKQWGIAPEDLDVSVLQRVPVRLSYIDQYFDDRYQMQPQGGYTAFFKKMLDSPNIDICLSTDALERITLCEDKTLMLDGKRICIPLVFTGPLDELFDCKYGRLPYRSLHFSYQTLSTKSFQPTPGVAYPVVEGYTRITEFSKLMTRPPCVDKTIVAYEYPEVYGSERGKEAYYPILTKESQELYNRYLSEARKYPRLYPCGRLGDFKYYNMDQSILRALDIFKKLPLRK